MSILLRLLALLLLATPVAAAEVIATVKVDGTSITATSDGTLSASGGGSGCLVSGGAGSVYNTGSSTCGTVTGSDGQLVILKTTAAPVAASMSGDATLSVGGVLTIANLAVTNAKIADATIDLAAKVSGILPGATGGTGNGFFAVSGPATSLKTFTLPNASATILTDNAAVSVAQGGTGIASGTSGGVPYYSGTTTIASSGALTANLPVIGGGAGAAPAVGTRSGNTTAFVTTTGTQTSGDCVKIDASGNHIANGAVCVSLAGTNTWTGAQTFGQVVGGTSTQSGTSYTLAAADCGTAINFTSASAVTLTTLSTLPVGCHIVVRQGGAGQVTVADGAGATHVSASSWTKTRAQYSKIGLSVIVTTVFDIDGDGA